MSYLAAAFDKVCTDHKPAERWYVCLVRSWQRYGGPEEGGWWQTMANLECYKEYASEAEADAAKERVEILAKELSAEATRSHGEHCLRQMAWLEERGLESDFFPEDDGPDDYCVSVQQELPVFDNRISHYE